MAKYQKQFIAIQWFPNNSLLQWFPNTYSTDPLPPALHLPAHSECVHFSPAPTPMREGLAGCSRDAGRQKLTFPRLKCISKSQVEWNTQSTSLLTRGFLMQILSARLLPLLSCTKNLFLFSSVPPHCWILKKERKAIQSTTSEAWVFLL